MRNFSDVWKDSRSRHVQGRKAEFLQHCLNIAERYIPQDMREDYRLEIVEEKDRLRGVYRWADLQDSEKEDHLIFGTPLA